MSCHIYFKRLNGITSEMARLAQNHVNVTKKKKEFCLKINAREACIPTVNLELIRKKFPLGSEAIACRAAEM